MIHDLTLTYMYFTLYIPVLHITITTQIIYNVDDTFLLEFLSDSHHHLRFLNLGYVVFHAMHGTIQKRSKQKW